MPSPLTDRKFEISCSNFLITIALIKNVIETIGLGDLLRLGFRRFLYRVLCLVMVVSTALMIWKSLIVATCTESPIIVVLSGAMEPSFNRGDLLMLNNYQSEPIRVGEIVVFKIRGREIPIVHRVLRIHEDKNGTVKFLTKGDNNSVDDRGLYADGQFWLEKKDVIGRAKGFVPYVGMVTIAMNDYPKLKYLMLALLGFFVLENREN
ncbi:Signal peptidase complex catalytic subunit SEC11C [Trichoplax sp. H2]|nr:Signal peptidase complex catalytic subunit SEC11C [Trichoplax sp. H2]|eukprot:RDD46602.1 Signal peptidase complex catalytic subunit SEC11C [Trichoplax sp. H2]